MFLLNIMVKTTKYVTTFAIIIGLMLLPIATADAVPGVSVKPGDSYVWQLDSETTDEEGTTKSEINYRLINVTGVSTLVESTEITYNDYIANQSAYEGIVLEKVNWNTTATDSTLVLNNTSPKNNFGGFVNLETADLTDLEDLTENEQVEFFINFLFVSSTTFQFNYAYMVIRTFFSFASNIVQVNSSTIDSVSKNMIKGNLLVGYSLYYDLVNTWNNLSISVDFELKYGSSSKLLEESTIEMDTYDKFFNDTTDTYQTKQTTSDTSSMLVYPEGGIGSQILGVLERGLNWAQELTGLSTTVVGLIAGGVFLLLIIICVAAGKKKKK